MFRKSHLKLTSMLCYLQVFMLNSLNHKVKHPSDNAAYIQVIVHGITHLQWLSILLSTEEKEIVRYTLHVTAWIFMLWWICLVTLQWVFTTLLGYTETDVCGKVLKLNNHHGEWTWQNAKSGGSEKGSFPWKWKNIDHKMFPLLTQICI